MRTTQATAGQSAINRTRRPRWIICAALAAGAVLTCPVAAHAAPGQPSAPPTSQTSGTSLAGKTVLLDPGHQGSAAGHRLDKQVPDGRGGTKDCQTTGATSVTGVAEHTINWDVAQLVKAGLQGQGANVILSRPDDTGWGGCVDERARAASAAKADIAVNIHADSTSTIADTTKKGFHIIVPQLPITDPVVNKIQSTEGIVAARMMRDAFTAAGFTPANYAGVDNGLQTRSDVAAVNLTAVPDVFIEMGNLSNPDEAKALSDTTGQVKYAAAIANGIVSYLSGGPVPASGIAPSLPLQQNSPGTPISGNGNKPVDLSGLGAVVPLLKKLSETKNPSDIQKLLLGDGQDVSSQVLKSILSLVYAIFGGKLPV